MVEKTHTAGWLQNVYGPLQEIGQKVSDWFAPRADASAGEAFYEINIELPGVRPEDVDVSIHDNSIIVQGEKHSEHEEEGRSYFFSEREYGMFQRSFRLPPDADPDKIDASYNDGILCLKVAKQSEIPATARKVQVRRT